MRVFEALACGSLLLTNDLSENGQNERFADGVHLATYADAGELVDKLRHHLAHDATRQQIAAAGRERVLANDTYRHRMERLLEHCKGAGATRLPARLSLPEAIPAPNAPMSASATGHTQTIGGGDPATDGTTTFPVSGFVEQDTIDTGSSTTRLTSIVILTHNQWAFTRMCLDSLRAATENPYELVVVDNGSHDGTVEHLRAQPGIRLIENRDNRGFPAAANQGIVASRGQQIVLLNNDCVLGRDWLLPLLTALEQDPRIGLVGPCSNCVSGPQHVPVTYTDLADLDSFTQMWARRHAGQLVDVDRLVGFCLLLRRELVDRIGLLDERFGIGNYEDDDYCRRAIAAGYRAVIARGAFVHHFGHRTFLASRVDLNELLDHNSRIYAEKWRSAERLESEETGAQPALTRGLGGFRINATCPGGLRIRPQEVLLSLCMIVRDSAGTLPACLESIRPWVDEMIVVDTGSLDETVAIAQRMGARVFHFPWCDDFSAARNESLRHARGRWLFWMDSDDTIDANNGRRLRDVALGNAADHPQGYVLQVHCPGLGIEGRADVTVVDHVKLFRNDARLRFEGRIHEQILPAIRRVGGDVEWTDIYVVHSGSDQSAEGRKRKQERDLRILQLDLAERPDHPFVLFNLGMTYADVGQHERAVEFLKRSLQAASRDESHVRKAYALLAGSQLQLGRLADARQTCGQGLALFSRDPELLFRQGIVAHQSGQLEDAVRAYEGALANADEPHFSSIDRGIVGFKARHNLALAYEDAGKLTAAEAQWRQVIDEMPTYREGWRGLADNLLRQRKYDVLALEVERLMAIDALAPEAYCIRAQLAQHQGDSSAAGRELQEGRRHFSEDIELRRALCQWLFTHGTPQDAVQELRQLAEAVPDDPGPRHNLGTVYLRLERPLDAITAYRHAIGLRPNEPLTHLHLGYALEQVGRLDEAVESWLSAQRSAPHDPAIKAALARARNLSAPSKLAIHSADGNRHMAALQNGHDAIQASLIIPVLDSHEIVRRQLMYFNQIIPTDWEVILLDDGSEPSLQAPSGVRYALQIVPTHNQTRWTQGLARNLGARLARGRYLLMTDIDHVISAAAVRAVAAFRSDRMVFPRQYGVLDERGQLRTDDTTLVQYGLDLALRASRVPAVAVHQNTFAIDKQVFLVALDGGYDAQLCGRGHYGGDDIELNERYGRLVEAGHVSPDCLGPSVYVFPDPTGDRLELFHSLSRD